MPTMTRVVVIDGGNLFVLVGVKLGENCVYLCTPEQNARNARLCTTAVNL